MKTILRLRSDGKLWVRRGHRRVMLIEGDYYDWLMAGKHNTVKLIVWVAVGAVVVALALGLLVKIQQVQLIRATFYIPSSPLLTESPKPTESPKLVTCTCSCEDSSGDNMCTTNYWNRPSQCWTFTRPGVTYGSCDDLDGGTCWGYRQGRYFPRPGTIDCW